MEEKAFESNFNISGTDLKKIKFRQRSILRDRSVCKKCLTRTQETLHEIEKDVSGKLVLTGVISATAVLGGAGRNFFGAPLIIAPSLKYSNLISNNV